MLFLRPPDALLAEIEIPPFLGVHNGDLVDYILLLKNNLLLCEGQKKELKKWADNL